MRKGSGRGNEVSIQVSRDRWGIAHIRADDEQSAFEAQGWVAAQDRFWQMDSDRLKAQGRWAEVVGPKGAKEDAFFRRLGLAGIAKDHWQALSPNTKEMTEAYALGVNRWLRANENKLPPEYQFHDVTPLEWEPWHCVAVYKIRHIFMGTLHRKLWRGYLLAKTNADLLHAMLGDIDSGAVITGTADAPNEFLGKLPDLLDQNADLLHALSDIDGGSNSWALDGSRTHTGLPLLAGDPHRGIEFPNVYHQFHMQCPEFNAIGLGFPGVPGFPHFGHNEDVAWCITHGMADDTDLFVETEDLADVEWRTETLVVRGEGEFEVMCGSTPRGPVVIGDPAEGIALAMAWTGIHGTDTTFDALIPMLKSANCLELENAVRSWVIPVNNLLSADRGGNISFKIRGRLIERPPANRWIPVMGNAESSWAHLEPVAFESLPHKANPDAGYLVTANNRVALSSPYISLDFAGPSRFNRITELLKDLSDATVEDMASVHADVLSLKAPEIIQIFIEHARDSVHPKAEWAISALQSWDCKLSEDSPEACLYSILKRRWCESVGERLGVVKPELGAPGWPSPESASRMLADSAITLLVEGNWRLVSGLEDQASFGAALSACVDETLTELEQRLGEDTSQWHWGKLHRMASPHLLASAIREAADLHPPIDSCPGDGDTVRCGSTTPETGERATAASVARYAFDLGNWDNSGWVVPHGVSGVRGSGHDINQREMWLNCELLPMSFSEAAVTAVEVDRFEI